MSTAVQSSHFDIVRNIEEFYAENAIDVYCPGTDVTLKFKPMSVKQLKKFIELQVAAEKDEFGVLPGLKLLQYINDVIVENCLESDTDVIWQLTTVDRDAIVVQLRCNVKSKAEVGIATPAGETEQQTETIDLLLVVDQIKNGKLSPKLRRKTKTFKFGSGTIKAKLSIPTLRTDNNTNKYFATKIRPKLQKGKKSVEKDVENILSQIYFLELCKYIDQVVVMKGKDEDTIDFTDHTKLEKNMDLLEKLPSKLISELSEYITEVKDYRDSIFCYTNSDDKDIPLNVDAALFTGI